MVKKAMFSVVLCVLALSAQAAESGDTPNPPSLSKVDDILSGKRVMFPVDDLLIGYSSSDRLYHYGSFRTWWGKITDWTTVDECATSTQAPAAVDADFAAGVGRMFSLTQDTTLVVQQGQTVILRHDGSVCGAQSSFPNSLGAGPAFGQIARGDFNGDSYADFAVVVNGLPYPITAKNVDDPQEGVTIGAAPDGGAVAGISALALATGDFDSDGKDELAMLTVSTQDPTTLQVVIYDAVQSSGTMKFEQLVSLPIQEAGNDIWQVQATAGSFTGELNVENGRREVQLLVAYGRRDGKEQDHGSMVLAAVAPTLSDAGPMSLSVKSKLVASAEVGPNITGLASANLDFFQPAMQAVLSTYDIGSSDSNHISVVVMNSAGAISIADTIRYYGNYHSSDSPVTQAGIAIGNFGRKADGSHPLALQIASLDIYAECNDSVCDRIDSMSPRLRLFDVDPADNFKLSGPVSNSSHEVINGGNLVKPRSPARAWRGFPWISVSSGDLQGRSLRLGAPIKLTSVTAQPTLTMGMPPTHVDWVKSGTVGSVAGDLNISAIKQGYYTEFATEDGKSSSDSSKSTFSYTVGGSESGSVGYTFGGDETGSFSVNLTVSASATYKNSTSHLHSDTTSDNYSVSSQTGNSDTVYSTQTNHNIYVYPILGEKGCPADSPPASSTGCDESDKVALNLIISGPSSTANTIMSGANLEWYQPVWEPNQIFSYPWTQQMLKDDLGLDSPNAELTLLSKPPVKFVTDDSTIAQALGWSIEQGSGSTSGYAVQLNQSASMSTTITPSKIDGGPSASATYTFNSSQAFSGLSTQTHNISASTGIKIAKPGTFANAALYGYEVSPFIYGHSLAKGSLDDQTPTDSDIPENGALAGPLRIAYAVSLPAESGLGSWWTGAYDMPDIALNHPNRWQVTTSNTKDLSDSCLAIGTTDDTSCATFNPLDASADELWNNEGLWMRGLFITPDDGTGNSVGGPQLTQITAGESVNLAARVYNYSTTAMPEGSSVVVQFYGQEMDNFHKPVDSAFLIGNVTLAPLPAFGNNGDGPDGVSKPNWALATTRFDTRSHGDKNLIFWVVAVGKTSTGMVAEMPGHGLFGIPPTLSSIADTNSWMESHSNNVGYYHHMFYIASNSSTAATASVAKVQSAQGNVPAELLTYDVTPDRAALDEKVSVKATLHIDGVDLDGIAARLYDGDPGAGGELFDQEIISHMRDGEDYEVRVPFRAKTCGKHALYLSLDSVVQALTATLEVPGDPVPTVQELIDATQALSMRAGDRQHLVNLLLDVQQALATPGSDVKAAIARYRNSVDAMSGNMIPAAEADGMKTKVDLVKSCVAAAARRPSH